MIERRGGDHRAPQPQLQGPPGFDPHDVAAGFSSTFRSLPCLSTAPMVKNRKGFPSPVRSAYGRA
jgi:hypothetical protein